MLIPIDLKMTSTVDQLTIGMLFLQVVFKFFLNPQTERNRETIRRAGLLLWQLLMAPKDQICPEIQKEVCLAIRLVLSAAQTVILVLSHSLC